MVTDVDMRILEVNPAFTTLTGYSAEEARGHSPAQLHTANQTPAFFDAIRKQILEHGNWQGELWIHPKHAALMALWVTVNTLYDAAGVAFKRVVMFSDITERKQVQELIWHQANFDPLTDLPNRRMFEDRLRVELLKAQRSQDKLAVLFLDLDRFKAVNDTLGHEVGDQLLAQAAQRLKTCVRASDTVARLGGDEFTAILPTLDTEARVDAVAQHIIDALSAPFDLGEHRVSVGASVGIAIYPVDSQDLSGLLTCADQAMYAAKHAGRGRYQYFKAEAVSG